MAGLFSSYPAFYVNWGRFTQLAGQAILLIAWVVVIEVLNQWRLRSSGVQQPRPSVRELIWPTLLGSWLVAGVFFLHFRVAIFLLILLVIGGVWMLWQTFKDGSLYGLLAGVIALLLICALFVLPTFIQATEAFYTDRTLPARALAIMEKLPEMDDFFAFSLDSIFFLIGSRWLQIATVAALLIGLIGRNPVTSLALVWALLLFALGNGYRLQIYELVVVNLGAVLIMYYLPIALVIGAAADVLLDWIPRPVRRPAAVATVVMLLLAALPAVRARARSVEPHRHFVTESDRVAMNWIGDNIAADAPFVVNTFFWLPDTPHGTDAGYWLPYFTGNPISAGVMLMRDGSPDYRADIIEASFYAEQLVSEPAAASALIDLGYEYVYIGSRGDFVDGGLDAEFLIETGVADLLHSDDGVRVLRLRPAAD